MRKLLIAAGVGAAALALAGCQDSKLSGFFGSSDPCVQGDLAHAGFLTIAANQPKVAKYRKQEAAAYAAFRAQCSDGNLSKVTLAKLVNAYVAALTEYKH
jgi:proline racemase